MAIFHYLKGNNSEYIELKGEETLRYTTAHIKKYLCESFMILDQILSKLHVKQAQSGYFSL